MGFHLYLTNEQQACVKKLISFDKTQLFLLLRLMVIKLTTPLSNAWRLFRGLSQSAIPLRLEIIWDI
jgi:hypothetical protein